MFTRAVALSVTFLNLALMPSPGSAQTEVANSPQWLIVTTTELAAACAPLTDLRAQQGYKVQQLVGKSDRTNQDWTSKSIEGWVREQREKHIPPQPDEPFRYRANKTGFKETLALPRPLADGKLEIRMMLIKEGKGALGTHSIVLKSRAR